MLDTTGDPALVQALRQRMAGTVRGRADTQYEAVRHLFNGAIETKPRMIAQCANPEDVATVLAFGREHELDIAVRSGGHGVAGTSLVEDGLVIDTRPMNAVWVDVDDKTVTVGGGALWRDVDIATQPFGLAATGGRVSTTGVAGLTLGGGSGWIERKYGLTCDNLVSVDLVTADGTQVTANEREHPDLFWALHGGGGNFGVATSFTFRLHEVGAFSIALMLWPADEGQRVTERYRDFMADAPDEIGGGLLHLTAPPEPFVPEHLVGSLACAVLVTCLGDETELRTHIAPLLDLTPEGAMIMDVPYADLQCMLDDPPGYRNYWSGEYLQELPYEAITLFTARAHEMIVPSPSQQALLPWGGAVARNDGKWPLANRAVPWVVHPLGLWEDPAADERARKWARGIRQDMRPWTTGGVYLNFIGDEGQDRVVAGFGRENYDRLARIKAEFDPDNVFRRGHNVPPAQPAGLAAGSV